jgi:transposase InsO family protein
MARLSALTGRIRRSSTSSSRKTDDVDLNAKLAEWERFYNFRRPHGSFQGKTPYEALRYLLE